MYLSEAAVLDVIIYTKGILKWKRESNFIVFITGTSYSF